MFIFENSSEEEFEQSIGKAVSHIRGQVDKSEVE